jgi:histidinol-phosphate aminotransferase
MFLRTFSKAFGLAGLRLGYTIAHPAVTRLLMRAKVPWNISSLTLAGAAAALDDVAEFESRVERLREGRAYLARELARIPGLSIVVGEGNFVLIDAAASGVASGAIVDAMLEAGIFIRSLAVHHMSRGFVRVTVGTAEQNQRCVEAMRKVIGRLSRRAARPALVMAQGDVD